MQEPNERHPFQEEWKQVKTQRDAESLLSFHSAGSGIITGGGGGKSTMYARKEESIFFYSLSFSSIQSEKDRSDMQHTQIMGARGER